MATYTAELPLVAQADVVVLGGGSAGCTAAIAAARCGADVLLVERYGFLGGTSTMVLDTFYGFYIPGEDSRRVVGGIPWEIVERLRERGMVIERPSSYGAGQAVTYDPPTLVAVWEEAAGEAGARLLLHTICVDVLRDGGGRVTGLVVASKAGLGRVEARVFVDASGDADLCFRAGAPFEDAREDGRAQSLTTTFRVANVDEARAREVKRPELVALMREASRSGAFRLPREEGSVHRTPTPGVIATNMTRVPYVDATDPAQLGPAEIEGRRQALEYARFLRERVPGYERSYLVSYSTQIGVRESRRVCGDYRLTREDVLAARTFEDSVARCGAPIEDHHAGSDTRWEYVPAGRTYGIPLRCLLPQGLANVLVAGRCLSATHDAHASVRSMGQCMAMGQAAGTAAALALGRGGDVRATPASDVRARLASDGALL